MSKYYNPVIVVNKKLKALGKEYGLRINNVVREVDPYAYDKHTKFGQSPNIIVRPKHDNIPARMVTYVKAGTFSNLIERVNNLTKIINDSNNKVLRIKAYIINHYKIRKVYDLKSFIDRISQHFAINPSEVINILNTLASHQIIDIRFAGIGRIFLEHITKQVDITKCNDSYTNQFKKQLNRHYLQAKEDWEKFIEDYKNHDTHSNIFRGSNDHILSDNEVKSYMSKDMVTYGTHINKVRNHKITKKYRQAVKAIKYILDLHHGKDFGKCTAKEINKALNGNYYSVLHTLVKDKILMCVNHYYMINLFHINITRHKKHVVTMCIDTFDLNFIDYWFDINK